MEEWKEYKLKDATSILGDGIHGTPKYDDAGPVFFINGNNLENGKIVIKDNTKRVSLEEANKHKKPLTERTLFVSINGTLGNVARYNGESCILGKSACYFNVKEEFDIDFIYYVVANSEFKNEIERLATGTTIKNVSLETMRNYTFYAPSLKTQKQIASILKSLDDKIEVNRKINDNLEQQAQALFKSWFVDFEPFKDGEFVESELGMIPKGWRVVSLGDLMCYNGGSQPPASEFIEVYKEGYIRFIQIRDYASDGHITYIPISKRNKLCDVKDIMIARYGASLGRICFGLKGAYNVALAKVTPLKDYFREYLRCFLNTREFYEGINNKGNRAVQAGFNQSDIQSFRLPFPTDDDIIMVFEKLCSSYFERRLLNDQESRRLAELRDTLLPKLMSGELKVNEPMN